MNNLKHFVIILSVDPDAEVEADDIEEFVEPMVRSIRDFVHSSVRVEEVYEVEE